MSDFYDPLDDAPIASFVEDGDCYAGTIARHGWVDDKYKSGQVMAITLRLDKPLDDCTHVTLMVRSELLRRKIGRAYTAEGRDEITDGDWLSVTKIGDVESASGGTYKDYDVDYRRAEDPDPLASVGADERGEGRAARPSLFDDAGPAF